LRELAGAISLRLKVSFRKISEIYQAFTKVLGQSDSTVDERLNASTEGCSQDWNTVDRTTSRPGPVRYGEKPNASISPGDCRCRHGSSG
jgi:hypothetical protein